MKNEQADGGDEYAKEIVKYYIEHLAIGITNMVNIFQPEVVCIGGGVSNQGDSLLLPLREIVAIEQYTRDNPNKSKIVIASLGNDAGIVGAAGLGR